MAEKASSQKTTQQSSNTSTHSVSAGPNGIATMPPAYRMDLIDSGFGLSTGRVLQTKLTINQPGDVYEREADEVADQIMRMPQPRLQRKCACGGTPGPDGECEACKQKHLAIQRKAITSGEPAIAPTIVHEALRSPGQPLDSGTRSFMEPRFGHDFSQVRVYTDAKAAESARALNASAYTAGRYIVFDAGKYQPNTSAGRQLIAHELSHTIQQGAASLRQAEPGRDAVAVPFTSTASPIIQRAMKFEFQTSNVVWRTGGKKNKKLPRKFGPDEKPKHKDFLHKGSKGKPAKGDKEGTAVELQSEAGGFVEFETSWDRDWCDVKEWIQEAVDMVDTINTKSKVIRTVKGIKTVEFPFDVSHLKKTKDFPKGLRAGESLEVEILDPAWSAKIQASESFELPQFESYLTEHMDVARVTSITSSAKTILQNANTAKIPDKNLVNLHSLLQIIVETITEARKWNTNKAHLAKEYISLMSRTNLSSMFHQLLSKDEQNLFKAIVKSKAILKELGVMRKTLVFPSGFVGKKSPGPTIHEWLISIYKTDRDLLSSLGGDNKAMGRFSVEKEKGKKDTNLVKFEARATKHIQQRPVVEWVAFAEEVFKAAHTNRPRMGSTELKYDPTKCP